ncbi:MAG TPA: VOC family protein [Terracidiphilus sp.]|jgi:catechol 2,3-dioxygenase-like lactoylglutathione lyase family enzyme
MPIDIRSVCPLLAVFDMPTSLRFYRDLLGFEIHFSSDPEPDGHIDWVWLRRNDADLMLNTMFERSHRPLELDPVRVAAHGDTQLYIGCQDLDAAAEYLKAAGVAVKGPMVRPFGMRQLFFRDPDNYELCLQWPAR